MSGRRIIATVNCIRFQLAVLSLLLLLLSYGADIHTITEHADYEASSSSSSYRNINSSNIGSDNYNIDVKYANKGREQRHQRRQLKEREILDPPMEELPSTRHMKVWIVYSAYITPNRKYHLEIIREQLLSFHCNGLLQRAERIFVPISIDRSAETDKLAARLVKRAIAVVHSVAPNATVSLTLENRFEYPGIRKVWDLGQLLRPSSSSNSISSSSSSNSLSSRDSSGSYATTKAAAEKAAAAEAAANTIIVYYHTKGMFNTYIPGFDGVRVPIDVNYNHLTFDRWDTVLDMFQRHPQLNKVGCAPAAEGHVWFNFFYTRASYVQRLVNPTIHSNRFYYEHWLGKLNDHAPDFWPKVEQLEFSDRDVERGRLSGCADCWSTCAPHNETIGMFFQPDKLPPVNKLPWYRCRFNHTTTRHEYQQQQQLLLLHDEHEEE